MTASKKTTAKKTARSSKGSSDADLFGSDPAPKKAGSAKSKPVASKPAAPKAAAKKRATEDYSAKDIEVLEGLEPVRRRPGMYIGGTDERSLHHLFAEVLDNSMDEAVAGHASWITVHLAADGALTVGDNGRGIPIDPHPKYKDQSALEVIMTTLHAGGKFGGDAYETSGGLHGVGISVVNALSEWLVVEVAKDQQLYEMRFERGHSVGKLQKKGAVKNRRGTSVSFLPDHEIFGKNARLKPARLYKMARSKAYLFGGVEIRWSCDPSLLDGKDATPEKETIHFPNGLVDYLAATTKGLPTVTNEPFTGKVNRNGAHGGIEWAITWFGGADGFTNSYCNTIHTPEGGTHVAGLRAALNKGIKAYGEMSGNKKTSQITADDIIGSAGAMLSVFIREPEFVGQTKDRLSTTEASRLVENAIRDHFDHWLSARPQQANKLLDWVIDRSDDRLRRKQEKEVNRKSATRKLRLPGKLADCSQSGALGSELFIVEGDSAGGSAKQARERKSQAVLPLRGKILNVANASATKMAANQQIGDLTLALGVGTGKNYLDADLRYEKVIIMTDADVDGAHIASLLITFFYQQMPEMILAGHLYLAVPPLYKLAQGGTTLYARDDEHKDELLETGFKGRGKIDISRFKGLGEMLPAQLKVTTMNRKTRTLLKVVLPTDERDDTDKSVSDLMGNKPELRFQFIQEHAAFATDLDI
ncbi:MAG: DNA topoisomerase IV subunit B [Parvibaculaceae bacterium]|nr:DNA topoisomerase IV subunit B [Parvibaculaceae bacterium]